jgi:predicted oxidoreductase (fatty acid repression mutant protein)
MVEFAVWTALAVEGIGASLQHYNPIVDEAVRGAWNLSSSWKLLAQMPFGSIDVPPGEKEFLPIQERVFVAEG